MITKPAARARIEERTFNTIKPGTDRRAEFDWFLLVLILLLSTGVAFIGTIAYVVLLG